VGSLAALAVLLSVWLAAAPAGAAELPAGVGLPADPGELAAAAAASAGEAAAAVAPATAGVPAAPAPAVEAAVRQSAAEVASSVAPVVKRAAQVGGNADGTASLPPESPVGRVPPRLPLAAAEAAGRAISPAVTPPSAPARSDGALAGGGRAPDTAAADSGRPAGALTDTAPVPRGESRPVSSGASAPASHRASRPASGPADAFPALGRSGREGRVSSPFASPGAAPLASLSGPSLVARDRSGAAARGAAGPAPDGGMPEQPPPGGASASAAALIFALGGVAILSLVLALTSPAVSRLLLVRPAMWRPAAFVPLLERPG
jgi:hypothetical protein